MLEKAGLEESAERDILSTMQLPGAFHHWMTDERIARD